MLYMTFWRLALRVQPPTSTEHELEQPTWPVCRWMHQRRQGDGGGDDGLGQQGLHYYAHLWLLPPMFLAALVPQLLAPRRGPPATPTPHPCIDGSHGCDKTLGGICHEDGENS